MQSYLPRQRGANGLWESHDKLEQGKIFSLNTGNDSAKGYQGRKHNVVSLRSCNHSKEQQTRGHRQVL